MFGLFDLRRKKNVVGSESLVRAYDPIWENCEIDIVVNATTTIKLSS